MVDISGKTPSRRIAKARTVVRLKKNTVQLIISNLLPKGNVFEAARIAGILAAKNTHMIIPLCHQLKLDNIQLTFKTDENEGTVEINSTVSVFEKTGAEMEAIVAVNVASLTLYDMCKAVDDSIVIENTCLISKTGGKTDYQRSE